MIRLKSVNTFPATMLVSERLEVSVRRAELLQALRLPRRCSAPPLCRVRHGPSIPKAPAAADSAARRRYHRPRSGWGRVRARCEPHCRQPSRSSIALCVRRSGCCRSSLQPGDIVVADPNAFGGTGGLIDVNPDERGPGRPISSNATSAQDLFPDPTGVAFVSDGTFAVADPLAFGGTGGLIRVDPDTGQQTPLSNNTVSSANLFVDPVGVAVDPIGRLIVADARA